MGLQRIKPPSLPVPPKEYDPQYLIQLIRSISLYFGQIASEAPTKANTANWNAVPTTADLEYPDLTQYDMYRGATEDILRIKVDGLSYVPIPTQAEINQAEADAIAASNAFTTAGLALKVNKAGDTMTGSLNVPTVNATNVVSTTQGGIRAPGMVLQVQQAIKTDTFTQTTTGNTYYPVPGLSVNITPKSATSKILVTCVVNLGSSSYQGRGIVFRNSTPLGLGNADALRTGVSFGFNAYDSGTAAVGDQYHVIPCTFTFLDSPASASLLTYSISVSAYNTVGISVNRSWAWQNTAEYDPAFSSTITVMEIAQ